MHWSGNRLRGTDPTEHKSRDHRLPTAIMIPNSTPRCNVDVAWDARTGTCGLGGVFGGSLATPDLSESRTLVSSTLMAEVFAIRLAVMTAAFSNIKSLVILSDSLTFITLLKGKETRPGFSYFEIISFSFIPRIQNIEVDYVAKAALAEAIVSPYKIIMNE
uniref:RNase H type-1 domain-containing protein n=1 Tax=Brassica oleracea TaxID=3712 RepID=A0A3P6D402_BRAOL|nr:unnamed protein product [Brassica oleracea]